MQVTISHPYVNMSTINLFSTGWRNSPFENIPLEEKKFTGSLENIVQQIFDYLKNLGLKRQLCNHYKQLCFDNDEHATTLEHIAATISVLQQNIWNTFQREYLKIQRSCPPSYHLEDKDLIKAASESAQIKINSTFETRRSDEVIVPIKKIGAGISSTATIAYNFSREHFMVASTLNHRPKHHDENHEKLYLERIKYFAQRLRCIDGIMTYDVDIENKAVYSIYTYPGDFGECLKNYTLTNGQIRQVIEQCISALAKIHTIEIIHRDFKPGNIVVDIKSSGEIKAYIIDIGTAYDLAIKKGSESFKGTCKYVAPEMLKDTKKSPSVDCWSLGITLAFITKTNHPICKLWEKSKTQTDRKEIQKNILHLYKNPKNYLKIYPRPRPDKHLELLIWQLTRMDPSQRIDATQALKKFQEITEISFPQAKEFQNP